jgi:hypothetical protein
MCTRWSADASRGSGSAVSSRIIAGARTAIAPNACPWPTAAFDKVETNVTASLDKCRGVPAILLQSVAVERSYLIDAPRGRFRNDNSTVEDRTDAMPEWLPQRPEPVDYLKPRHGASAH